MPRLILELENLVRPEQLGNYLASNVVNTAVQTRERGRGNETYQLDLGEMYRSMIHYVNGGLGEKQNMLTAGGNIQINGNIISATDTIYDDTEVRELIDTKQDTLIAGNNIQINDNVISATDTIYDDTGIKESIAQEVIDRGAADANLQQQIDAFAGALIYIGTINLATSDVTQSVLNTQAQALGKYPPQLGYVLVDNNGNDWWYNGSEWINIGYYEIAQASNTQLGVVKGSTANMKVSVDGSGEMSVNGLQNAFDGKAPNSISLTAPPSKPPRTPLQSQTLCKMFCRTFGTN
jgi:hypothetical protein